MHLIQLLLLKNITCIITKKVNYSLEFTVRLYTYHFWTDVVGGS